MTKYKIYFEQLVSGSAEIEAESPEEARDILLTLKDRGRILRPGPNEPIKLLDTDSYRFDSDHIMRNTLEVWECEHKCIGQGPEEDEYWADND